MAATSSGVITCIASTSRTTVDDWLDEAHEDNTNRQTPNPVRTEEPPFNLTPLDYGLRLLKTLLTNQITRRMKNRDGHDDQYGLDVHDRIPDRWASWVVTDAIVRVLVESTSLVHTPSSA
jgi:hypothetical protein